MREFALVSVFSRVYSRLPHVHTIYGQYDNEASYIENYVDQLCSIQFGVGLFLSAFAYFAQWVRWW